MKEIFFFCLEFYTQFPEQEAGQARPRWEIILKETYGLPAEPHLCLVGGLNVSRTHGIHPILLPLIVLTLWILSQSIFHKGSECGRVQQWWHNNTWPKSLMLLKSVFCTPTRGGQRHSKAAGAPILDQLSASGKTATGLAYGIPAYSSLACLLLVEAGLSHMRLFGQRFTIGASSVRKGCVSCRFVGTALVSAFRSEIE